MSGFSRTCPLFGHLSGRPAVFRKSAVYRGFLAREHWTTKALKALVTVQVTSCRGWSHTVSTALHAAQLVNCERILEDHLHYGIKETRICIMDGGRIFYVGGKAEGLGGQ